MNESLNALVILFDYLDNTPDIYPPAVSVVNKKTETTI